VPRAYQRNSKRRLIQDNESRMEYLRGKAFDLRVLGPALSSAIVPLVVLSTLIRVRLFELLLEAFDQGLQR
jgi:hypothetical protein